MLKEINVLAQKFDNNVDNVKNELKRVQSVKCRLKKQKARNDYEQEMSKVVCYEQSLKEVRDFLEPKGIPVTMMTENDIKVLNYEETIKAIKSIQSKKCNSQFNTVNIEDNLEYQEACKIEQMLLEHKKTQKPIPETSITKSSINELISTLESTDKVKKDQVLEMLKKLL